MLSLLLLPLPDNLHGSSCLRLPTCLPAHAYIRRRVGCVVDVGGGTGGFMALLLSAHPHLTGVVLEQEEQVSSQHTSGGVLGLWYG